MAKHMLIDATHPEEIRVVVVDGKRLEEFDIELASKKQLKGNIYLAKVTRVEPSLQAAFVDYGGNRHGFLAFSEIHPDYYRIPVADREALLAEEAREAAAESAREEAREAAAEARRSRRGGAAPAEVAAEDDEAEGAEPEPEGSEDTDEPASGTDVPQELWPAQALEFSGDRLASPDTYDAEEDDAAPEAVESETRAAADLEAEPAPDVEPAVAEEAGDHDAAPAEQPAGERDEAAPPASDENGDDLPPVNGVIETAESQPVPVETIGGDEIEEVQPRRTRALRSYKIQEVIKRRQVMLVQVTKEERGTKGAALTTYLSLAGRYCVLMPNTARGGGVSRKISNPADRKRLKAILAELDIPEGMAVIIRTAGAERSKAELKRDYEYLLRLWDEIRELTLKSTAPALVYEEANLIKRSIRDVYSRDIEDVIVDGEEGYKVAKSFMRTLTPSHAKRVQLYRDPTPLFHRYQVESQLDAIHNPVVQLKSGGYIVINSTEALVAIDVNSGRATRERNIEETAYKTNLEAAEEIARQLRLRDLAGLIVIDFIDMEEPRHNAAVERKLKEAMRHDRARIQIGRISAFGLLELSRQRMRPSLFETSTEICKHCRGTGHVRSTESTVLHVLRSIEDECLKSRTSAGLSVAVPTPVALYILNHKRKALAEIEQRHGLRIFITGDDHLIPPEYRVERLKALAPGEQVRPPVSQTTSAMLADEADDAVDEEEESASDAVGEARETVEANGSSEERRRKRSRRRRRGRERDQGRGAEPATAEGDSQAPTAAPAEDEEGEIESEEGAGAETPAAAQAEDNGQEEQRRRRRRGRRGGRRRRRNAEGAPSESPAVTGGDESQEAEAVAEPTAESAAPAEAVATEPVASADAAAGDETPVEQPTVASEPEPAAQETAQAAGQPSEPEPAVAPAAEAAEAADAPAVEAAEPEVAVESAPAAPEPAQPEPAVAEQAAEPAPAPEAPAEKPASPPRRGWWRRLAE